MIYFYTTCALNFVPCAKLLAESIRRHIPGASVALGLSDDRPAGLRLEDEGFDQVYYLDDFQDHLNNARAWAFGHTIMELATALKPFVAGKLMQRNDCEAVLFFDPDCVLFESVPELQRAVRSHSVVLTPHASLMHENPSWIFFEKNPLKVGSFNLGFLGLRNNATGRAVASWWRFRLREHCLIDPEQGLFTDQKWFDLLPGYIDDIKVMREPVYNLARWNTFQRTVSKLGDRYLVDGEPLQFVHFSGFYKIGSYVQGLYDRSSAPHVKNIEILEELSLWYSQQLDAARTHAAYTSPWSLGRYGNGQDISQQDRRRYRSSAELRERYPDPFSTERLDSFWLHCQKQDRTELETRFEKQGGIRDYVLRNVRAHDAILRQFNEHLNLRLDQATRSLQQKTEAADATLTGIKLWISNVAREFNKKRLAPVCRELVDKQLFDPDWYLKANADVAAAGRDPLEHFLSVGLREGRAPLAGQPVETLLAGYIQVLSDHHRSVGQKELEAALADIMSWISETAKKMSAGSIAEAGLSLIAQSLFDPAQYCETYPDVAASGRDPLEHFLTDGLCEGRVPFPGRATERLLAGYIQVLVQQQKSRRETGLEAAMADIKSSIARTAKDMDAAALARAGVRLMAEGLFDRAWYLAANPDVAAKGRDPLEHFLRNGLAEGRAPVPRQDAQMLIARYLDVLVESQRHEAAVAETDPPKTLLATATKDPQSPPGLVVADDVAAERATP